MISFILVVFFSLIIAYLADKYNKKTLLFLCIAIITCFAGLRGENVGIDTSNYYEIFIAIYRGQKVYGLESFFVAVSGILMNFFKHPAYLIFIYSAISNVLILCRLWTMRKKSSFPFSVFVYFVSFYLLSMNIQRQFVAIAIVFFGTLFLEKRKYILYWISLVLGCLFHTSAIIGIVILFVYLYEECKHDRKKRNAWRKFLLIGGIPLVLLSMVLLNYLFEEYQNFFETITYNLGVVIIYKILCLLFMWLIWNLSKKTICYSVDSDGNSVAFDIVWLKIYIIGLIFSFIGMFFQFADRIALCCLMFEMPFWGQMVRAKNNKHIYILFSMVFLLYLFIMQLINNGQGIFPYTTVWG